MTFYSLLTVAGTVSLTFGGNYNTKDRLSYSEDNHDYPSKKWASGKYDHSDRPSGYGHAYGHDPYERTYGKAYSMHGDDYDKHYDDYRSSKQWKRPSYSSKDSKGWKKDSDKYGKAYSYDPYKRTYGKAYSTNDYKKDHIVEEPKVTASPQHWKKSDYSKSSRDWKKNDGKYSSKVEPKGHKYEPATHSKKDYSSKDAPKHEPNKHKDYSSKDEPKDHKDGMKSKHDGPSKHEQPKDYKKSSKDYDNDKHDDKYGTAYSMLSAESENASCPSDDDFDMNAPCDYEGTCGFGEETCCGETFVSLKCQCAGTRSFCYYTDACFGAQC